MLFNKEEALKRCDAHHNINGRIYKTLEAVLNDTSLPEGTNLVVEYVDRLVKLGIPYVATTLQIDTGADCAEFWRVMFDIFFGKDIGVNSRAQAANSNKIKEAVRIDDRTKMRVLDTMYLDLSSGTAVSHVMGMVNPSNTGKEMVHTTQVKNTDFDLRYQAREYYISKYGEHVYKWCMRYVTDEELASVTIGNYIPKESEEEEMVKYIPGMSYDSNTRQYQLSLLQLDFELPKYGADGEFGKETLAAHNAFQESAGLAKTEDVNTDTQAAMWKALRESSADTTEIQAELNAANDIIKVVRAAVS